MFNGNNNTKTVIAGYTGAQSEIQQPARIPTGEERALYFFQEIDNIYNNPNYINDNDRNPENNYILCAIKSSLLKITSNYKLTHNDYIIVLAITYITNLQYSENIKNKERIIEEANKMKYKQDGELRLTSLFDFEGAQIYQYYETYNDIIERYTRPLHYITKYFKSTICFILVIFVLIYHFYIKDVIYAQYIKLKKIF